MWHSLMSQNDSPGLKYGIHTGGGKIVSTILKYLDPQILYLTHKQH